MMEFERFEAFFHRYCHDYSRLISPGDPNLELKKDHSLRVASHAGRLAENENFGPRLTLAARLAGLFHDIGRFEQYVGHKTFKDTDSVDHAKLGFKILARQNILDGITAADSRCIRLAVLFHNRLKLPRGLPEEISMVSRAVRDADKLDIFPVMISHLKPGGFNNNVVTLGLEDRDAITPAIFEQVSSGRLGEYSRMRYVNDFKLLICSWVYDLNFAYSCRQVLGQAYIQKVFELLPDRQDMHTLKSRIVGYLENTSA